MKAKKSNFFEKIIHSRSVLQTGFLMLATVSNIITQIIINGILARSLSQEDYGNYAYFINLFTLCQTFFNFGFFYTICRLISVSNCDTEIREYYFEGLKFLAITSLVMVISLYIYSFFEYSNLERNGIIKVFWFIIPLSVVYLMTNFNEQIFQGNNRIAELSISRAIPKFIFAIILLIFFIIKIKFSVLVYLILYLCAHLLVYLYLIRRIKPIFYSKSRFKDIWNKNKSFGVNVYLGSLLSVGVASLMGILISNNCENNVILGYYNIALQITTPLTLIPNILSTVFFSKFAISQTLNKRLIIYVVLISGFLYFILYGVAPIIIKVIFGEGYLPATNLIRILGIGSILYGIADFFNRFILACGKAVALRNIAITIGITYLFSGYALIPVYLAEGASYAKVLTGFVYILLEFFYTKRLISKV